LSKVNMIEEKGIVSRSNPTLKQKSLLVTYDIPVDNLSYEYIESCKDVKKLERIIKILRSGEEGYYPDLQKTAEERLQSLSPNNRHLRFPEPALNQHNFSNEEWNTIKTDVSNWKKEISVKDLRLTEENNNSMDGIEVPPIRQLPHKKNIPEKIENVPIPKTRIIDYTAWDKYDADTELLKMDMETEQSQDREIEEKEKLLKQAEKDRLELIVKDAEKLSETERRALAEQEKDRGNEYYQAKEYTEAEKYYTLSLAIWPTPKAYNNRAACYLKQCKYSAALADANSTLALEPDNIKALFRRGVALQHKNKFREALADMAAILKQQPKHLLAQHIARELREQILSLPRPVRIMTDEGLGKPKRVVEMDTRELRHTPHYSYGSVYEVNEWGLPKVMCQCNGAPRFLQLNSRPSRVVPNRNDLLSNYPPSNSRIVEINDEPETPRPNNSTKLEIIEVEKSKNEPVEDFFMPKKCNIVDRRTQKHSSGFNSKIEEVSVTNGELHVPNVINGDSSMDEEFESMSPLLDDMEPKV